MHIVGIQAGDPMKPAAAPAVKQIVERREGEQVLPLGIMVGDGGGHNQILYGLVKDPSKRRGAAYVASERNKRLASSGNSYDVIPAGRSSRAMVTE